MVIYGCSSCDLCFPIRTNTCVMKWSENVTSFGIKRDCNWLDLDKVSLNLASKNLTRSKLKPRLACVASVSARVRRERRDESKKKEWRGRGRGKKEPLARKSHDFEKLRSWANTASDWCGAVSVDYLALETSIKPGMLCLRASQIWSHLICGRRLQMLWTDIYLNRTVQRFMRSESSKYIWRSSGGD